MKIHAFALGLMLCLRIVAGSALAGESLAEQYAAEFQSCYGGTLPEDTAERVQTDLRQEGGNPLADITICAAAWLGRGYDCNRPEEAITFGLIVRARVKEADLYELHDGGMEQQWPLKPGERRTYPASAEWDPDLTPLMFDQAHHATLHTAGGQKLEFGLSMTAPFTDASTGEVVRQYGFAVNDALMARLRELADAEGRVRLVYTSFVEQWEGEPAVGELSFLVRLPD